MRQFRHLAAALLLLAAAAVPAARTQEEIDDQKEFNYIPGDKYGPENWYRHWPKCGTGKRQSPINISNESVTLVPSLGYLNHSYRPAEAFIINRGHDIKVNFSGDAGSLVINGTAYNLRQVHWHSPSEHTINGRRYDMELHMVHESAENKAAVIGILYQVGASDGFLLKLEPFLRRIADRKDAAERVGIVDPRDARGYGKVYYRYMGSLTTPPCDEGVIWTIVKEISTVSKRQLELLREAVDDGNENNARPLQKLNGRDIGLFDPKPRKD